MMRTLRSLLFDGLLYSWTAFCVIVFIPTLISRRTALWTNNLWAAGVFWLCKHVLGLNYEIKGRENLPQGPYFIASKHQSAWETMIYHVLLTDAIYVLKKELMWIPLFGWFLKRLDMIPVSRSKKKALQDLRQMLQASDDAVQENRTIVIFPEGTRSKPGFPGTYHAGVAVLYSHLSIPVVPVALNSGLFWPRKGLIKKPGLVTLEFLKPIQPGLSKQAFMALLEERIEEGSLKLYKKGLVHVENAEEDHATHP
ncbi:1-acyl-sn-glycerol-3-phosphate acyltransferase [Candidatus Bealeia paramacronuclearis]|uniref:1-acyl-sn-glycerol-3-phosphate acyltransferase n=1 Tax=Candidatus Bealeia paramacronuclearis TaxID=1921001 RepID=A0ABZ2C4V9_9PROT|nr:1-acyl-sn-glycerol-3-phosphate acyltransferase [Candidatus Bealeia paramacronuclearis]